MQVVEFQFKFFDKIVLTKETLQYLIVNIFSEMVYFKTFMFFSLGQPVTEKNTNRYQMSDEVFFAVISNKIEKMPDLLFYFQI